MLAKDENGAMDALAKSLPVIREHWEPRRPRATCSSSAKRARRAARRHRGRWRSRRSLSARRRLEWVRRLIKSGSKCWRLKKKLCLRP